MPKMWLIGAGVALAALLIASVAIAVVRKPEPLPEGTPKRTVQLYLEAVADDDLEAADNLLSAELRLRCPVENMASRPYGRQQLDDSRVTLKETTFVGDKAFVTVRVSTIRGNGPFGTSARIHEQRYTLVEEAGAWRFVNEPWPYQGCVRHGLPAAPAPTSKATPVPRPAPTPVANDDDSASSSSE
jgi:hypothetical protein